MEERIWVHDRELVGYLSFVVLRVVQKKERFTTQLHTKMPSFCTSCDGGSRQIRVLAEGLDKLKHRFPAGSAETLRGVN